MIRACAAAPIVAALLACGAPTTDAPPPTPGAPAAPAGPPMDPGAVPEARCSGRWTGTLALADQTSCATPPLANPALDLVLRPTSAGLTPELAAPAGFTATLRDAHWNLGPMPQCTAYLELVAPGPPPVTLSLVLTTRGGRRVHADVQVGPDAAKAAAPCAGNGSADLAWTDDGAPPLPAPSIAALTGRYNVETTWASAGDCQSAGPPLPASFTVTADPNHSFDAIVAPGPYRASTRNHHPEQPQRLELTAYGLNGSERYELYVAGNDVTGSAWRGVWGSEPCEVSGRVVGSFAPARPPP